MPVSCWQYCGGRIDGGKRTKGFRSVSLQWRYNGGDSVSNHQPHDCLLKRSFRLKSKKTSKLRVTGLCVGNSPVIGEFPSQMASNAGNVSIWWRHHVRHQSGLRKLLRHAIVILVQYTPLNMLTTMLYLGGVILSVLMGSRVASMAIGSLCQLGNPKGYG